MTVLAVMLNMVWPPYTPNPPTARAQPYHSSKDSRQSGMCAQRARREGKGGGGRGVEGALTCQQEALGPARCSRHTSRAVDNFTAISFPPGRLPTAAATARARPCLPAAMRSTTETIAAAAGVSCTSGCADTSLCNIQSTCYVFTRLIPVLQLARHALSAVLAQHLVA